MQLYYIYNNQGTTIHSSNVADVNTFYIIKNDDIKCINNWPFIVNNDNLNKNNDKIFKINVKVNIDETVFLLKCEIHNAGH